MSQIKKEPGLKNKSKIFYWYGFFAVVYAACLLLIAPPKATLIKYHLTSLHLRILDTTLLIPILAIWFAAFYGYYKMSRYSKMIKDSKDGKQISKLTFGILLLTISLPIGSITTQLLKLVASHNPDFTDAATIISNYVSMLLPLGAFFLISHGVRGLVQITKKRPSYLISQLLTLMLIIVGVLYGYAVSRPSADIGNVYHMPIGLVLTTLVIPYLYTWFLGILAAYEMHLYSQNLNGEIYRRSWDRLAYGFASIIVVSVFLQYLGTLSVQIQNLSLKWILSLVYALLILLSVGYVLLALGAQKLIQIEEV